MIASLQQGQAHLWRLPLAEFEEGRLLEAGLPLLSGEERERYARALHPRFRALLLAGRLLMRCALSSYGSRGPAEWRIEVGENGKPFVSNSPQGLTVNLSHTEGIAVLLVAVAASVGVDVERPWRILDPLATGRPVFSDREMTMLRQMTDERERRERFYRIWTVKESLVKAVGAGITGDLRHVTFDVSNPSPRLLETVPALAAPADAFFFAKTLPEGFLVSGTIFPFQPVSAILDIDAIAPIRGMIREAIGS
ncbi:MAG: 4'-phosphopantetheinyl transferase family protein [Bryobacteraceae bacterium]